MDEEYVSFVDSNCNEISNEEISSHIGLANLIVESDEALKEEYKESGRNNTVEFLILDKGYFSKGTMGAHYKQIVYSKCNISDKQRKLIAYLKEEGYTLKEESQFDNQSNKLEMER